MKAHAKRVSSIGTVYSLCCNLIALSGIEERVRKVIYGGTRIVLIYNLFIFHGSIQ